MKPPPLPLQFDIEEEEEEEELLGRWVVVVGTRAKGIEMWILGRRWPWWLEEEEEEEEKIRRMNIFLHSAFCL